MSGKAKSAKPRERKSFRLIFHVGAGKTGTSSIQETLRNGREGLKPQGYDYWGLMLESAPIVTHEWQKTSASKEFLALDPAQAQAQMTDVLVRSVRAAESAGIHTAIWSNEWFFDRAKSVIPALKRLEAQGVKIEIVAYVRRHDAWAKSAYLQWGIKHKTYDGPLMPFGRYIRKRPASFISSLRLWFEAFPDTFHLRNFDATDDVVEDFRTLVQLANELPPLRVNESPGGEELLLRALYNSMMKGETAPAEFERLFQTKRIDFGRDPLAWLESLLPTGPDLDRVRAVSREERQSLNRMLASAGQPAVFDGEYAPKPVVLSERKLVAILFQMLVAQAQRVQRLQREVNALASATGNQQVLEKASPRERKGDPPT